MPWVAILPLLAPFSARKLIQPIRKWFAWVTSKIVKLSKDSLDVCNPSSLRWLQLHCKYLPYFHSSCLCWECNSSCYTFQIEPSNFSCSTKGFIHSAVGSYENILCACGLTSEIQSEIRFSVWIEFAVVGNVEDSTQEMEVLKSLNLVLNFHISINCKFRLSLLQNTNVSDCDYYSYLLASVFCT